MVCVVYSQEMQAGQECHDCVRFLLQLLRRLCGNQKTQAVTSEAYRATCEMVCGWSTQHPDHRAMFGVDLVVHVVPGPSKTQHVP